MNWELFDLIAPYLLLVVFILAFNYCAKAKQNEGDNK
jgi:hypothetical protein